MHAGCNCRASCKAMLLRCMQGAVAEQASKQLSGLENWHVTRQPQSYIEAFQNRKPDLVYLTADSPNKLCELDNSKLYIIGGIVDRNRHKNICFRKAESQVCTASHTAPLICPDRHLKSEMMASPCDYPV